MLAGKFSSQKNLPNCFWDSAEASPLLQRILSLLSGQGAPCCPILRHRLIGAYAIDRHVLLKQQLSVIVYRLFTKENKLPFPFCRGCLVPLFLFWVYKYIETAAYIFAAVSNRKQVTEAHAIFLNQFTVCSSCKCKFLFVRLLTKEQTEFILLQNILSHL
jgi:hypothetical protein